MRRGLSARLERHMERGEELMELNREAAARNREAFDRNTDAFERNREAFDRNTDAFERYKEADARNREAFERVMVALDRFERTLEENTIFIRDMNRRNEKVVQQIIRDHEEFMRDLFAHDRAADERTQKILIRLDEAGEESRAHREALLTLIDRLPPPAEAA